MRRSLNVILTSALVLIVVSGCNGETAKIAKPSGNVKVAPTAPVQMPPQGGRTGKVLETMSTAGYTYVLVDTGKEKIWAAAPEFQVKVGDEVTVPPGAPMKNYHSKTLNRDFDMVYFVGQINQGGAQKPSGLSSKGPSGMPAGGKKAPAAADMDFSGINKPQGGKTIAEIFAGKADLSDKEVVVRGKVVKFSPQIMGKNWIHLQDGTGAKGTNDLTITTSGMAQTGDTVLVKGKLGLGIDFGSGYKYDVIIQDADVTVE